jgi:hypothetical protein
MDANINFFFTSAAATKFWKKATQSQSEAIMNARTFQENYLFESTKSPTIKEKGIVIAGNILGLLKVANYII